MVKHLLVLEYSLMFFKSIDSYTRDHYQGYCEQLWNEKGELMEYG